MLKEFYELKTGKTLDFDNLELFTEKLQWLKLFYTHPDLRRCVDKADFKGYVKEKVGGMYTAELLDIWNTPKEVSIKKFLLKNLF